jgi:hypothetical protein
MITNNARCIREIESRIIMAKKVFRKKKDLFTSKLDFKLLTLINKFYHFRIALYGAKPRTLRKVDQKYLEYSEMWCWRRLEIIWNDSVKNDEAKRKGISQIQHKVES